MRKGEYRIRTQRFLTGEFRVDDLTKLLLFLREYSYGNQTVYDVGNMLGHADSRSRGISVSRVSDLYEIIRFALPAIEAYPNNKRRLDDLPPRLIEVMDAAFGIIDDTSLLGRTGLSRAQASTALKKLKRKFITKPDGRLRWSSPSIHVNEFSLIQCLTSIIPVVPAYNAAQFVDEMSSLLLRHGFMDKGQEHLLEAKKPHLILFAIAAMHGVRYLVVDGEVVEAEAGWIEEAPGQILLKVFGKMTLPWRGASVSVAIPIFETDLSAEEWVADWNPNKRSSSWEGPIELSADVKLVELEHP